MNSRTKNRLLLLVIAVVFLSPVIISWWVINYTEVVSEGGKSNHGDLIRPPVPIDDLDLFDPIESKHYKLYGKWSLVYIADYCEESCVNNLYRMRQIHTAMDKHSLRVQRVLILAADQQQDLTTVFADYAGQRIARLGSRDVKSGLNSFKLDEEDDPVAANRLYIIDPLGNLMMSYPPDINPQGIMKDLKKLLKASRAG